MTSYPGAMGRRLIEECRTCLAALLPLTDAENRILDRLLDSRDVVPDLLTEDFALPERIGAQPLLGWKALNVRRHRGSDVILSLFMEPSSSGQLRLV